MRYKTRFNIITFGCDKNTCDSELLMGYLKNNGMEVVHEQPVRQNDIVIVNTCGFINDAKQESIDHILDLAEARKAGNFRELIVAGCLSQRYMNELKQEIPEVDAYFGINFIPKVLEKYKLDYRKNMLGERVLTTPSHYAWMKISDGCNHACSFCAIPLIKGKYQSEPIENLVAEAKLLVSGGVREIILIAQDTTWYGLDLYNKRSLARLLDKLSDIDGLEWIRLLYTYPADFPMDILELINKKPNICNYLDIPVQHISEHMLSVMRRRMNRDKTIRLLNTIREKVPGIALRTSLIIGHPGEKEDYFDELLRFVKDFRFDRLGVFSYSHEENTHSYSFRDEIPAMIKQERLNAIMETQRRISLELNQAKIGREIKVVIDRRENDYYTGRTEFDTPGVDNEVILQSKKNLKIGSFYQVKITDAFEYDLEAKIVK